MFFLLADDHSASWWKVYAGRRPESFRRYDDEKATKQIFKGRPAEEEKIYRHAASKVYGR